MKAPKRDPLYARIREILESARFTVVRSVNTTQVVANWLIGREIVEEQQRGRLRAEHGKNVLRDLSRLLRKDFGGGYSVDNLEMFRRFYHAYPSLILDALTPNSDLAPNTEALRRNLPGGQNSGNHAARGIFLSPVERKLRPVTHVESVAFGISDALRRKSWHPGWLHPNLSWTHYRTLLRVDRSEVRSFYEIEATTNGWSARELERQINTLLYERLALSKDRKGLLRLAQKGHEIQTPADVFKDPVVLEFLGLPRSHRLVESDLETALIGNLQAFLLEMGKGFALVSRQERITISGDHFYIDLVFYHTVLKCFVLIDLKVGKLTHQDLGQLQLYVNYYDRNRRTPGDQPTLGLILCTDKNDAVVKYTLGANESKHIFASRYKLLVPTVAELQAEIRRELRMLHAST
jgi:predicted nuclease of restriction endonuclease-like (RecB) superfamily